MKLIFLDTESTGTEEKDRLIQLAFSTDEAIVNELFRPSLPIEIGAMAIHHITEQMVLDKAPFINSGTQEFLINLIAGGGVVVAHNAKFDIGMLAKEEVIVPRYIDTLKIARYLDPEGKIESYSLQYLRYFLGLVVEATAHDAMGDILVLEQLYQRLYLAMGKKMGAGVAEVLINDGDIINKMIEVSAAPILLARCNFKKHKGELWADIAKSDPSYMEWALTLKDIDEDLTHTLKYYLGQLV